MLDSILGVSSTTFDLKSRIIRHTANVPLFVEEVCRRLKETDILRGRMGRSQPRASRSTNSAFPTVFKG